ncbi:MAG: Clp1/GlmU family protein [Aigarchaeota archaeon]|nr:Clp1/GlmU family protein [Aigarchaeota archaeon]MDW8092541.1 Clp1/GlmU family protein [Nitrososphaerota archaeon]
MRLSVTQSHTVLAGGPCRVRLVQGDATIFGYHMRRNVNVVARPWRILPIHAVTDSELEVEVGEGGTVTTVDRDTIPDGWKDLASTLEEDRRVLILGSTDSGKTSLATYLYNNALSRSKRVILVELDTGQSEMCPPTTMGVALSSTPVYDLYNLRPNVIYPFGYTSSQLDVRGSLKVASTVAEGLPRGLVIIDSDGWVMDEGAALHKTAIVDTFKPSDVVILGDVGFMDALSELGDRLGFELHLLDRPTAISKRRVEDRRDLRVMNYTRYLSGSSLRSIPRNWSSVEIVVSHFSELTYEEYIGWAIEELRSSGRIIMNGVIGVQSLDTSRLGIGIISYLYGPTGAFESLGLFMGSDKNFLRVFTPYRGPISLIKLGGVVLSRDFEEVHVLRVPP